jgi:hypothetical protein
LDRCLHFGLRERVLSLPHPDFVGIGAPGRRWDTAGAAVAMEVAIEVAAAEGKRADAREFWAVRLASGVVLLTHETHRAERVTLRSSVWVRVSFEWRLRFHRGKVVVP